MKIQVLATYRHYARLKPQETSIEGRDVHVWDMTSLPLHSHCSQYVPWNAAAGGQGPSQEQHQGGVWSLQQEERTGENHPSFWQQNSSVGSKSKSPFQECTGQSSFLLTPHLEKLSHQNPTFYILCLLYKTQAFHLHPLPRSTYGSNTGLQLAGSPYISVFLSLPLADTNFTPVLFWINLILLPKSLKSNFSSTKRSAHPGLINFLPPRQEAGRHALLATLLLSSWCLSLVAGMMCPRVSLWQKRGGGDYVAGGPIRGHLQPVRTSLITITVAPAEEPAN